MTSQALENLFLALDVSVDALAMCEVGAAYSLSAPSGEAIIVHYVLDGAMRLSIEGLEPVVCPKGGIVIVAPHSRQTLSATAGGGVAILAQDHVTLSDDGLLMLDAADGGVGDLRFACGGVSANIAGLMGLFETGSAPVVEDLGDLDFVAQAFELMLQEMTTRKLGARALSGALMKACMLLMIRRRADRGAAEVPAMAAVGASRLGEAMKIVLAQPGAPHTLLSLAAAAGMSRSSFAKAFVAAFAMTPMNFVLRTRLHHAADALRSTTTPIKVIAADAGFASRSHFSRSFRAAYGVDPSAYREQTPS